MEIMKEAYVVLKKLSEDEEAQMIYEAREKALRDDESRTRTAFRRGEEKGRREREIELAKNFLKIGISVEQIAIATNMQVEEIENLR